MKASSKSTVILGAKRRGSSPAASAGFSASRRSAKNDKAAPSESTVSDFFKLLKPGVMSLVVFSGLAGMLLAPTVIHPFIGFVAILCISLGSGASGAINMWYDRDIDKIMKRTQNRPIPAGRLKPETAIEFGVVAAAASVILMAAAVNFAAAGLLLAAILFYVFIYTMGLKRRTPQNIVIGGAAGAFPPVIGWAAATGDVLHPYPWLMFLIIFLWTPPHFWALALYRNDDYRRAKVPMLPVVAGAEVTKWQMLIYTLLMIASTLAPWWMGYAGGLYAFGALALGAVFLLHNLAVLVNDDAKPAMRMFGYSILYLFALFGLLVADHWL